MWETRLSIVDWGYFKIQILQEMLKTQKINIRRSFVLFRKSNICTDQLDVQEANVSISQLHRIRNHIVGCWFAYGWFTCARLVGSG